MIVNGTNGADHVQVSGSGTRFAVTGLPALDLGHAAAEGANDALVITGLGGDDTINASTLAGGRREAHDRRRRRRRHDPRQPAATMC